MNGGIRIDANHRETMKCRGTYSNVDDNLSGLKNDSDFAKAGNAL